MEPEWVGIKAVKRGTHMHACMHVHAHTHTHTHTYTYTYTYTHTSPVHVVTSQLKVEAPTGFKPMTSVIQVQCS